MGTRSTYKTRKSRCSRTPRPPALLAPDITHGSENMMRIAAGDPDLADALAAAVLQRKHLQVGDVAPRPAEERRRRRREGTAVAVVGLEGEPEPVAGGAEQALGAALRNPPRKRLHEPRVGGPGAADQVRMSTHRRDDALAAVEPAEPRERVRHPFERKRE